VSNFDFSIPASATITGIEVEVEGNDGLGVTVDYAVQLSWDNSVTWTAVQAGTFTDNTDATTTLGGPADTWGHTWTAAEFAVFQLRIRRTAGGNLRVDRIRVNVHYTLASATIGLYRSVGTNAANLNTGPETVEITGSTAIFSGSMPANVGVGDVLQYQVGVTWYLAFISGRASDIVYTVQSSTGGTPQAAAAGTTVGVYRAYTSLAAWSTQNENPTINLAVRNFDTSRDLVTPNVVMNVACYGDGADTTAVMVSGWTTAATNDIRIYTPVSPAEVGTSQRHPGRWDTTKYRLEAAANVLWIEAYYARIEGLQVRLTADVADVGGIIFSRGSGAGVSGYEVSDNIVRGNGAGSSDIRIGINPYAAGSGVVKVWNNVIYDWRGGLNWVAGIVPDDPDYTVYIYNNTIVDCEWGIDVSDGTVIAKNNLVYNSSLDNYYGNFAASSTNNLSGPTQTDAPGSNPRNATTVTFLNAPGDDFHLGATDTGAKGQGVDLSADPDLAFAVDVDGGPRRAPWDIGADEAEALVQGHYHWRNDDGSETTATWPVAEDSPLTPVPRMTVRRVRFEVSNEGAVTSGPVEYRLQAARSGSCATATYTDVPVAATWEWQVADSPNFLDGDATTNVTGGVTDEATTFIAGQMKDTGNSTVGGITLDADEFTEIEFAVRATASAVSGAGYCFRLYDATNDRPLDGYSAYAQATPYDPTLALANHPSGQIPDQLTNTTPATILAFRFRLASILTVTVDTVRVAFTTAGGVLNGDVTAGELWEDTNGNGTFDGAGPDTLLQGGVAASGGMLTFTPDFPPAAGGTNYFVRATLSNLALGDTTTFSLGAADVDEVEAGVVETGSISSATHTQDPPMLVKSGTYVGNGATQSIADVGFRPDLVIISSDSTDAGVGTTFPSGHTDVLRTSTMVGNVSKAAYVYAYHPLVDRITSLDANGFSVGHPPDHNDIAGGGAADNDDPGDPYHCVNHSNVRYYWVAFRAAPGEMAVGTYTGDGAATQDVTTVGFPPDYTMVLPDNGTDVIHRFALMPADYSLDFDGGSQCPAGCSRSPDSGIRTELANGFRVGDYVNASGDTYHYVAWKNTPGRIAIGTYTGDSSNDRSISGLGFRPELVSVTNAVTPIPNTSTVYKTASTGTSSDYSLVYIAYSSAGQGPDDIQAIEADGFQVGTSDNVNAWNEPIHYAAFGPGLPAGTPVNYRSIGTALDYATGQVTVTTGSALVTGVGTQWVTANRGRGDYIAITGQGTYTVGGVVSETSLVLATAFSGGGGTYTYAIGRQYATLAAWEDCVDGGPCTYFPVPSASLVADNRREVGVSYKDSVFTAGANVNVLIDGSTTDANHTITLTADAGNRHLGVAGNGVVLDGGAAVDTAVLIYDDFVTVEWLEIRGGGAGFDGVEWQNIAAANKGVARYLLVHDLPDTAIQVQDNNSIVDIYDNIVYACGRGIRNVSDLTTGSLLIANNTIHGNTVNGGITASATTALITLRNNVATNNTGGDFAIPVLNAASSNNLASDATGTTHSPAGGGLDNVTATDNPSSCPSGNCVGFANLTAGSQNLHLVSTTYTNRAVDAGADLSAVFNRDIDNEARATGAGTWDVGADELDGFTAVKLASFTARGFESAVLVEWETASELDNLGFHLHRAPSPDGPWARLNASLIPGLGSSPEGRSYRHVDFGLVNGTPYFYRLEDVDRRGRATSHGPVSATPTAGVPEPGEGEGPTEPTLPPGETPKTAPERKAYGDPTQQSLRVLERTASGVTLELVTGGFYSVAQDDGTSKLLVPGFFDHAEPGFPTVPTRRLWTDAVVGRGVALVSVEPGDLATFSGLPVSLAGRPVAVAGRDGTYRASSIPVRPSRRGGTSEAALPAAADPVLFPSFLAVVHQTAFQGERKKAYLELAPLQVDESSGHITLARRLVVRLAFAGRVEGETGRGNVGRRNPVAADAAGARILARLATRSRGLHGVAFEEIPGLSAPLALSDLRLSRLGDPVAFHLEPRRRPFGPGSVLFFLAEGTDSAYGNEAVYELATGPGGIQMPGPVPTRRTPPSAMLPLLRHERSFERDGSYLPALLEARDLWVWDLGIPGGGGASYPFTLDSPVLAPETARLSVDLQGGSDTEADPDHHVLAFVNGSLVGETRFDGMVPTTLTLEFPTSLLLDGENTLRLENAGDTGSVASHVYLDRFSIEVPREVAPFAGILEGRAAQAGRAALYAAPGSLALDVTGAVPRFLACATADSRLAWNAEAGHRYLAVLPEAFLAPEVRPAPAATLRDPANQADWIVVAPQALLPEAETLRAHRESRGLAAVAVSLEGVVDEFGYGEAGPHAVQRFLASAFHDWQAPAPRYVLLLGEASYDPKGRLTGTSRPDLIPSPLAKSTFLWTPADPLYAAVNGLDSIPDIAIGRINAATPAEAEAAVQKILDFETSGFSLAGNATLVADNPDTAGDFEANQDEIAALLPSRSVEKLYLARLGATATKAAVRSAFDAGLSLMSYVGHGSSGLWASEGILRSPDVASFAPQTRQPLVLTMTCSNGYFLSPFGNSLAERLVLAGQKGAIAAFAPSGLSLNEAAHVYHRAVVAELELGQDPRLGDLLLAAQTHYAATGAFPELLQIYNLLGDPGMGIR
jgi:hypothetical protein